MRLPGDTYMTLQEIKRIPLPHYPIFLYSDSGSPFSWLIRKIDKSAGSHLWLLIGADCIANQSFTYHLTGVDSMRNYVTKLIWNPFQNPKQKEAIIKAAVERCDLPWYRRLYDFIGLFGELLEIVGLKCNIKKLDFCSEAVCRMLADVDPAAKAWLQTNPSPTPREFNQWTKSNNPPWQVYGRYSPDDEE